MAIADDIRLNEPLADDDSGKCREWTPLVGLEAERQKIAGYLESSKSALAADLRHAATEEKCIINLTAELAKIDAAIEALKRAFPEWGVGQ